MKIVSCNVDKNWKSNIFIKINNKHMDINKALFQFDLKEKEAEIYLAFLEMGTTTVSEVSQKTLIKRTTIYDILTGLIKKGLIAETHKGKKRLFFPMEPEKLLKNLDDKRKNFEEMLPVLKSIYNTAGAKPKILYYQGKDGLKEVYRDTLTYKGELLAFVSENIIKYLGKDFSDEYKIKRIKAKIFARVIGPDTKELIEYKKSDKKEFKKTILVSKEKYPFSIEMNIYGNKIALMSFKEEMGIIIESNEAAKNLRFLFELAVLGSEKK